MNYLIKLTNGTFELRDESGSLIQSYEWDTYLTPNNYEDKIQTIDSDSTEDWVFRDLSIDSVPFEV